ncbi:chemotaxis protein CheA [Limnohabitans sp. DCL3]|uniref:chemotaxis protein CheA n=1 Tax=Limnohabitans sp. DCL3 TaxID=3374103 RepID=UPI003A8C8651
MATELAFLLPEQPHGPGRVAEVLEQLATLIPASSGPQVRPELSWALGLCQQAQANPTGWTPTQIDDLQAYFERLSNALYLANPRPPPPVALAAHLAPASASEHHATEPEAEGFVLGPNDDLDMLNEFCIEGRELLQQVEQGVLVLEENPQHKDTLNQVFRAFHTFKGGAGFLGIEPIQHLAHELESVLDAARQNKLTINRDVIDLILAGGDALQLYVDAIARQLQGLDRGLAIVVPTANLVARAQACLQGKPFLATPVKDAGLVAVSMPSTDSAPTPTPTADAAAAPTLDGSGPDGRGLPIAQPAAPAVPTQPVGPLPRLDPAPIQARSGSLAEFVKLDTRKLDALVDLMGELVIAQSMVVQHPLVQAPRDRDLERHLLQLSRITTDLQRNAMSLRMVPIRAVMEKMTRLVRDLSIAQGKQIQLHLSGEDTELDRKIVEEMADPLLHMMRNAVDHGIELPAQRVAQGKSAQGNIHLQASHQGGGILIGIRDDGKGLSAPKILSKAVARGLIPQNAVLSDKEIFNLIFLPGFSTAESVTEVSGRGVGMDVVRGSINKLRGRVDIASVAGQGTAFNIFLPLTLAVIDAMLVGVGSERFIVPTLVIRESLRPKPGMVSTVQGRGEVIQVRGKLIPLVRLADKLDLPCVAQHACDGIVVVVDSGDRSLGLLVDSLMGKQEVVIKSLGPTFKQQKGLSGAAILGDGRVALIIDPDAIGHDKTLSAVAD